MNKKKTDEDLQKAKLEHRERLMNDVFGPKSMGTPKEEAKKSVSRVFRKAAAASTIDKPKKAK